MVQPHRLTQEPVEVAEQVTGASLLRRLTQEPVEVAEQVTGASLLRRLTQIVVEVPYQFPVHPFGELPFPEHPVWSPAYIAPNVENDWFNRASFFGYHALEVDMGRRRIWTKIVRR